MKRVFKRYRTNKTVMEAGWILTIESIFSLTVAIYAKDILDDIGEVTWVDVLFLIPALIHLLIEALLETILATSLILGLPCLIIGILLLILTFPYWKRISEVKSERLDNGGRLPGELMWEMYQNEELNKADYERELANNLRLTKKEKLSLQKGIPLKRPGLIDRLPTGFKVLAAAVGAVWLAILFMAVIIFAFFLFIIGAFSP